MATIPEMPDHEDVARAAQSLCDELQALTLSESNNLLGSRQAPSIALTAPDMSSRGNRAFSEHQEREMSSVNSLPVGNPSTSSWDDVINTRRIAQGFAEVSTRARVPLDEAGLPTGERTRRGWIACDDSLGTVGGNVSSRRPRHVASGSTASPPYRRQNDAPSFDNGYGRPPTDMLFVRARALMDEGALNINREERDFFSGTNEHMRRNADDALNERQESLSEPLHPGRVEDDGVTVFGNGRYRPLHESHVATTQASTDDLVSSLNPVIANSRRYVTAEEAFNASSVRTRGLQTLVRDEDLIDYCAIRTRSRESSGRTSVRNEALDVNEAHRFNPRTVWNATSTSESIEYRFAEDGGCFRTPSRPHMTLDAIQSERNARGAPSAMFFFQNGRNSLQTRMGVEALARGGRPDAGAASHPDAGPMRHDPFRNRRGLSQHVSETELSPLRNEELVELSPFEEGQRRPRTGSQSTVHGKTSFERSHDERLGESRTASQGYRRYSVRDDRNTFVNENRDSQSSQASHRSSRNWVSGMASSMGTPYLPHLDPIRLSGSRFNMPGFNGSTVPQSLGMRFIEKEVGLALRVLTRGEGDMLNILDSRLQTSDSGHTALRKVRDDLRVMLRSVTAMANAWGEICTRAQGAIAALDLSEKMSTPLGENSEKDLLCVIDLHEIKAGDEVVRLPCMHVFHSECLLPYLRRESAPLCPIDRSPVPIQSIPYLPVWNWEEKNQAQGGNPEEEK